MSNSGGYDPVTGYPITNPKPQIKAQDLTPQQVSEIRAKFDKYDKDKNGTLDKVELRALLEETLHRKLSDKLFQSYIDLQFAANDKNYNGVIEWDEFVSLYSKIYLDPELPIHMGAKPQSKPQLETGNSVPKMQKAPTLEDIKAKLTPEQIEEAKKKFAQYDKDGSGSIDKEELRELLKETMSKRMGEAMIKRYVDAQFQMYDKDGSGQISMDEFIALYEKMYISDSKGLPVNLAPMGRGAPPPGGRGVPMPGM